MGIRKSGLASSFCSRNASDGENVCTRAKPAFWSQGRGDFELRTVKHTQHTQHRLSLNFSKGNIQPSQSSLLALTHFPQLRAFPAIVGLCIFSHTNFWYLHMDP